MKNLLKFMFGISFVLTLVFVFPMTVSAAPQSDGRTVFGESYTLSSGRILEGDLNVIGGVVDIEQGATVTGNVLVVGGSITIDGTVEGDLNVISGTVRLEEHALIEGNVFSPGSYLTQEPGATIEGEEIQIGEMQWRDYQRDIFPFRTVMPQQVRVLPVLNWIGRLIGMTILLSALGGLLLLIMPNATEVIARTFIIRPWEVLGFGALTVLAVAVLDIILALTICMAPFAILLSLVTGLAALVGWLVLGYELGKQITKGIFKTIWHPALTAVFGNLILYLLARGLGMIPCLGHFLVFIVMLFGLGMTVITFFGTRSYPRSTEQESGKQEVLFQNDPDKETQDKKSNEIPGTE